MKKLFRYFDIQTYIIFFISLCVFFFYLCYNHLQGDALILFLASKIFLGKWLIKGILPLFNPHIFAGIPFAFDVGLGNLHPFNLAFMLPYPVSYASWVALSTMLFLIGYYLLFSSLSKNKRFALLLTFILFMSGSGFIRMINPTVYSVISHIGIFLYSLKYLNSQIKKYFFPLIMGILMTLSGHIQIVLYGYIAGLFVSYVLFKIPLKKLFIFYALLGISVLWYLILSLPLSFESTRMTVAQAYVKTGDTKPLHLLNMVLPFLFGEVQNGSVWGAGIGYQVFSSLFLFLFAVYLFIKSKISKIFIISLCVLLLVAFGLLRIPLLRGSVQIFILIHLLVVLIASKHYGELQTLFNSKLLKKLSIIVIFPLVLAIVFFNTQLFSDLFLAFYKTVKKGSPSLFYDKETVQQIGFLISHNIILILFFAGVLLTSIKWKSRAVIVLILYVLIEGIIFNYLQTYLIPTLVVASSSIIPKAVHTDLYRVQSTQDTIPYTGFFIYQENISIRPPFSKEKTFITRQEQKKYTILRSIFSMIPSSWNMTTPLLGVQGFSTFVPKKICQYFREPSIDWKKEYDYIILKNPLFGIKVNDLCINNIETSRITMYDPRWEQLGVRYFISDRPLKEYSLIARDGSRYFYENKNSPSIFRFIDKLNKEGTVKPIYIDPNQMKFKIKKEDVGKKLVIIVNPDGFMAKQNGKELQTEKRDFNLIVPIKEEGQLTVFYSPFEHLRQTIQTLL